MAVCKDHVWSDNHLTLLLAGISIGHTGNVTYKRLIKGKQRKMQGKRGWAEIVVAVKMQAGR